jgi:LmbE family N-acetylglucosaminyl deacetylase
MTDVLVIAAHPDDEVLGCGGTIARWARAGRSVRIAILGEGITARGARTRTRTMP